MQAAACTSLPHPKKYEFGNHTFEPTTFLPKSNKSLPERKTETGSSASSVLVLFLISEIDPPSDIVLSITSDSVCFVLFSYASDLPEPAEKSILIASDKV